MTQDEELLQRAKEARNLAYAPYSSFAVGAAVLASSGKIYTGCNIENASYGMTICAERVAIFSAIAAGERKFLALAVVCDTEEFCRPCGACRQVMEEFSVPRILMGRVKDEEMDVKCLEELLPLTFGKESI